MAEREREFIFLLHAGFLLIGVVTTLLGPILPMLAIKWSLDDAELGLFFMAQFTGAIVGSALSSRMIVRTGLLRLWFAVMSRQRVAVACRTSFLVARLGRRFQRRCGAGINSSRDQSPRCTD